MKKYEEGRSGWVYIFKDRCPNKLIKEINELHYWDIKLNQYLHCETGPAIYNTKYPPLEDGRFSHQWFLHGKEYTEIEWKNKLFNKRLKKALG